MLPIVSEPQGMLGGLSPALEVLGNYDKFRERYIVPQHEEHLAMVKRTGMLNASTFANTAVVMPTLWWNQTGLMVGKTPLIGDYIGWTQRQPLVDARKIDHLIKGYLGYYGKMALSSTDYVTKKQPRESKWWVSALKTLTGVTKESQVSGARDVQRIYELNAQNPDISVHIPQYNPMMTQMKSLINKYNMNPEKSVGQELPEKTKKELGKSIIKFAKSLRLASEQIDKVGGRIDSKYYHQLNKAYADMNAVTRLNK